jgi:hypothetical protein
MLVSQCLYLVLYCIIQTQCCVRLSYLLACMGACVCVRVSVQSSQQVCRLIHLCSGVEDTVQHADIAVQTQPLRVPLYKVM